MVGMDIVHWTNMSVFVSFVGANIAMMDSDSVVANIVKMETIKCLHPQPFSLPQKRERDHCGQRAAPQSGHGLFQSLLPS